MPTRPRRPSVLRSALLVLALDGCKGADDPQPDGGCIADHPRGADPIADAASIMDVLTACNADSGGCTASTPCSGSAEDRVCDASQFITAEAAICIAQGHGLPPGISAPQAGLVYHHKHRRIVWTVTIVLSRSAPDASPSTFREEGLAWAVDAITGALLDQNGYLIIA